MALSVLNNISSMAAENEVNQTQASLQKTLFQLASGSRINSGADDAAGLSIANGLQANITALTQSQQNANDGVGELQVADGALSQVTTLLNRAVTLATESATDTVGTTQRAALDAEFQSIQAEITSIGANTTFNGSSVFSNATTSIFLSDSNASSMIGVSIGVLSTSSIGSQSAVGTNTVDLSTDSLLTDTGSQSALADLNNAIANVAATRGALGAVVNRLQAAGNVMTNQVQNLTSAQSSIMDADMSQTVADMSKFNILEQTGMAALAQANSAEQNVLTLLK
jgi:flagellin